MTELNNPPAPPLTGEQAHWSEAHEGITADADLHEYAKKYTSEVEAIKGGYNAQKKLGSSFRIPDKLDTLTEEQRAELHGKVKALRNVPEKPEGYVIDRPKELPEGMSYSESMENALRAFAHERGWDNKDVNELAQWYNQSLIASYQKLMETSQRQTNEAINKQKILWPDYDKKMEGIKRLRQHVANELGLGYTDEKTGKLCSKLDDCLDMSSYNGIAFGNMAPVLQLLSWAFDAVLAEAEPGPEGAGGSAADTGVLSAKWYANPEKK